MKNSTYEALKLVTDHRLVQKYRTMQTFTLKVKYTLSISDQLLAISLVFKCLLTKIWQNSTTNFASLLKNLVILDKSILRKYQSKHSKIYCRKNDRLSSRAF